VRDPRQRLILAEHGVHAVGYLPRDRRRERKRRREQRVKAAHDLQRGDERPGRGRLVQRG
jgi:hypothetical protein